MSKNYIISTEDIVIAHNTDAYIYPYELTFPELDDYGVFRFRTLPVALAYAAVVLDAVEKSEARGKEYGPAYETDAFVAVAEFFFRGAQVRI